MKIELSKFVNFSLIIMIVVLCNSCAKVSNELCLQKTNYRITDFDGLLAYTAINDGLICSKINNKPIFLLFTGFGCVGDTSYEEDLFVNRTNKRIIAENYIPIVLYVDDRKELDDGAKKIVKFRGEETVMTTIGQKNTYYELSKFKQNSQPLMAILDSNGESIISPIGYRQSSQEYQLFLEAGLIKFNEIEFDK